MTAKEETIDIQKELFSEGGKLKKYQNLILGESGFLRLLRYEFIIGISGWVPGAFGLFLRSKFYPKLMGKVERNVTFGTGVVLRHPAKIFIGDNVVIDDGCVLDAKGTDNRGIFIGDGVYIGRNTILNCKNGDIILEDNVNIGANCMIFSASEVRVCENNLMAAYCYLVGGTHHFEDPTIPVLHQKRSSEGIIIGPGGWLGAHVTVFDGVRVGKHAVIGAGSVVHRKIPDYAIAGGNPITLINKRQVEENPRQKQKVTVGIINYNGADVICETLRSVANQTFDEIEKIVVADNGSTDDSIAVISRHFPDVEIIRLENNGPNPARNAVIRRAKTKLILLMDGDVILAPDAIEKLEETFFRYPDIGAAGPQVRFKENQAKVQYNGCNIHFAGGAVSNPYDLEKPVPVGALPGGAMMIDRYRAETVGLFDEAFMFGWEDGDFTFRMTLAGYPCLVVTRAHVYHSGQKKGIRWVKYQVRNRWWFMLKNLHLRTLIVALPAILVNQLAAFLFFTVRGKGFEYIKGSLAVWGSLPSILRKRKAVMQIRKLKDRQVLTGKGIDMIGDAGGSFVVRFATAILNRIFSIYWFFFKWLMK